VKRMGDQFTTGPDSSGCTPACSEENSVPSRRVPSQQDINVADRKWDPLQWVLFFPFIRLTVSSSFLPSLFFQCYTVFTKGPADSGGETAKLPSICIYLDIVRRSARGNAYFVTLAYDERKPAGLDSHGRRCNFVDLLPRLFEVSVPRKGRYLQPA
jgi:hypothetical protein